MSKNDDKFDSRGRPRVKCQVCGKYFHRIEPHIERDHDMTLEEYQAQFPGSPVLSEAAKKRLEKGSKKAPAKKAAKKPPTDVFTFGVAKLKKRKGLDEVSKAMVPVHDEAYRVGKDEALMFEDVALAVADSENVYIHGPTGCGKTAGVMALAAIIDQPVYRLNCNGEIRVADFLGDKTVEIDAESGQNFIKWVDGILPICMKKGWWLVLDELDAAPPHVLFALQAVLEKNGKLVIAQNGGEVVTPHKDFRVIATANTNGRGDDSGHYAGTQMLNEAFLDRFGAVIARSYPSLETEVKILCSHTHIDESAARKMIHVAHKVRDAAKNDAVSCTFSTRRLITWAHKTVRYSDARRAAKVAVTSRLCPEDAEFVDGIIQRIIG